MLTVCAFWWTDKTVAHKARYTYTKTDVDLLLGAVSKNLSIPHELCVVTDKPELFAGTNIRAVPLDRTTWVDGTRYAKLQMFSPGAEKSIGKRIFYLDLDMVITGSLDPIVDRTEDLVLFRNPNFGVPKRSFYNTSLMLLTAGSRPEFWDEFDPKTTPAKMKMKWGGSDQAWISHRASRGEAYWDASHGVYGAGRLGDVAPGAGTILPENARVVAFPGNRHLSQPEVLQKHPWIAEFRS